MMPTIRVTDDVFAGLQKLAKPFVDSPCDVIKRLLISGGVLAQESYPTPSLQKQRAKKGALTPQKTYQDFLLLVLASDHFKGQGSKSEVTKKVIAVMKSLKLIKELDEEIVSTGETRSENTIAWGRNVLKNRGLISTESPRGIWELTEEGFKEAQRLKSSPNKTYL